MESTYKNARNILSGIFAAIPTPVRDDGRPDADLLFPLLDHLLSAGVAGLCLGGATGEYPCFDIEDRIRVFAQVSGHVAGRAPLICGIGAENWRHVLHLAQIAQQSGAAAVLLPPPSYFAFKARDLKEILLEVTRQIHLPVLFYHIPQFTNRFEPSEAIDLLRCRENIVGIKDSAGEIEALTQFSEAKRERDFALLVGSDALLLTGLELKADGGISGTCSVVPQLVLGIYQAFKNDDRRRAEGLESLLQALASATLELPAPWGIKIALEAQGFSMGYQNWPVGPGLKTKIAKFRGWFQEWIPKVRFALSEPDAFRLSDKVR